jgi:nucleoside-diphosphate-sugar epimerase
MSIFKILITGSKGRIGKILTKSLDNEFEIYGLDLVACRDRNYFKCDISNFDELHNAFKQIGQLDCVIHLAADSKVEADWESVINNNIIGTKNVYECVRQHKIKKVIFASSNHATGGYEGFPPSLHKKKNPRIINTNDPIRPDSDYGTSKIFGEALARQYFELYGINSICLRIGSVLEDNDPTQNDRFMKTWLSHKDLIQLVRKAIYSNIEFGVYYGVSNNKGRFWDISNAEKDLGYQPQDDASSLR